MDIDSSNNCKENVNVEDTRCKGRKKISDDDNNNSKGNVQGNWLEIDVYYETGLGILNTCEKHYI